nr:stAR-related lipid transfer protein 5 isoform X2 [Oryctolagus cuniculus]
MLQRARTNPGAEAGPILGRGPGSRLRPRPGFSGVPGTALPTQPRSRAPLRAPWTQRWPHRWARRWPRRCSGTGETRRAGRYAGKAYRGEGIVHGTPEAVWDCVRPAAGGLREKWDENVTSFEVIESITETLCVSRTSTPSAAMKLISPRDFVDVVLVKTYEDGTISSNGSRTRLAWSPSSRPTSVATSLRAWWTPSSPAAWPAFTPTSRRQ